MQQSLHKLLETKDFDKISVHEIADAATVNRATFYDHYGDKFALLECMVGSRFHELLQERQVVFNGGCSGALKALVLALCDYLTQLQGGDPKRPLQPHMESAVIAVLRRILLDGAKEHRPPPEVSPEILAATVSWALYGAAREWVHTPNRGSSEEIAQTLVKLVAPILEPLAAVRG